MDDLNAVGPDMSEQKYIESKVYADVNERVDREAFDVRHFRVRWSKTDRYELGRKVGQGHFGEAYDALDTETGRRVVVKTLKNAHRARSKLQKEIKLLEHIRGGPNTVRLLDTARDAASGRKLLVFEKVNYVKARELFPELSPYEVAFYSYQILRALDYTHSRGVMHRDVKPSNILIDPTKRMVRLIDWGVAGFYFPREKAIRGPGTRCYKSPELSLRYDYYDYSVDMWAFGCTFGSMVLLEHPMVRGKGSWFNQLVATVRIIGSADLFAVMRKLRISLNDEQIAALSDIPKRPWSSWVNATNRSRVSSEAMDLLSQLMLADHTKRLSAAEAMAHPYFDAVREAGETRGLDTSTESGSYEYVDESQYVYYTESDE